MKTVFTSILAALFALSAVSAFAAPVKMPVGVVWSDDKTDEEKSDEKKEAPKSDEEKKTDGEEKKAD